MKFILEHASYPLQDGRWVAKFHLSHWEGATLHSQECLEPRIELTFTTEEEAKERSRQLARNWWRENYPDAEILEERASA
jgi:hypothetical protein